MSEREIVDAENLVIDAQFLIQEILNEKGLNRTDLARLTGVTKARLTQLMGPQANPTLRTLAKIFTALDDKLGLYRTNKLGAQGCGWVDSDIAPKSNIRLVDAPKSVLEDYLFRLKSHYYEASNENFGPDAPETVLAA